MARSAATARKSKTAGSKTAGSDDSPAAAKKQTPSKRTKKDEAAEEEPKPEVKRAKKVKEVEETKAAPAEGEDGADADVYITSSKACQAFKVRAEELQKLVKEAKPDASVFINAEKKLGTNPDKGTFAVRVKGKTLVELKAMPRPFTAMKALVIKDLADKVIAEL